MTETAESSLGLSQDAQRPPSNPFDVNDVSLAFRTGGRTLEVLSHVSLTVREGETVGIVGRSGTGKTTLLRSMAGLVTPDSGSIYSFGRPVEGPPDKVVLLFQDYGNALLPWRTVKKNVRLGLESKSRRDSLTRAEIDSRVAEALDMVGLSERADEYPWRLSGGMQQRVQLARALAVRPKVLLLDEPFGALDAMTKATMQDELLRVKKQTSATVVFITHDIDEAVYLGDRVHVLGGAPAEIVKTVEIELPEERDQITTREKPEFLAARHELAVSLEG